VFGLWHNRVYGQPTVTRRRISSLGRFLPSTIRPVLVGWAKVAMLAYKVSKSSIEVNSLIRMIELGNGLYVRNCPFAGTRGSSY
jgi:hypothetical protein